MVLVFMADWPASVLNVWILRIVFFRRPGLELPVISAQAAVPLQLAVSQS